VNFEDVESGNDHDMDAIVKYVITKNVDGTISVKTSSVYAAGSIEQHMGYVISGTNGQDGIYLEVRDCDTANNLGTGGIDATVTTAVNCRGNNPTTVYRYFLNTPPGVAAGTCDAATQPASCNVNLPLTNTRTFTPGTTSGASILKDPLWFAAKWGGFQDRDNNNNLNLTEEWDADGNGDPDNYFLVTNALTLGEKLSQAFTEIDKRVSSASSVSVNSGSISSDAPVPGQVQQR
jgi:type IV pilus assembly protein PilY1